MRDSRTNCGGLEFSEIEVYNFFELAARMIKDVNSKKDQLCGEFSCFGTVSE